MTKKWFGPLLHKFRFTSIRKQLLLIFVTVTLLPVLVISAGSIIIGYSDGRQQTFDQLQSLLSLREQKISNWTDSFKGELTSALEQEYIFERIRVVLDLAQENYYLDYYTKAVRFRLERYLLNTENLNEISVLDLNGKVVLSTNVDHEGLNYSSEDFFQKSLQEKTVSFIAPVEKLSNPFAVAALPVLDSDGQLLGILMGTADLTILNGKIRENTDLGNTGKAYLVSKKDFIITTSNDEISGEDNLSIKAQTVLDSQESGKGFYIDSYGSQVAGVYLWIPNLDAALFVEKDLSEVFGVMFETVRVNLIVAMMAVSGAVGASLLVTKNIAEPIMDLSQRADGIAKGDWRQISHIDRDDELGVLARALNSTMIQLRELINNLEEGIRTRTLQLEDANRALLEANEAIHHRAIQLETSSNISREITSILEPEELFQRVAQLIREAFGLNAVNIFMTDSEHNKLVLIANNYEDSDIHRDLILNIDNASLNGWVASNNELILANNVSETAEFLFDEYLPGTKSELVIPLRIAGNLIGTLDMQAFTVDAFRFEDLLVFQNLGDQIAIAIENSRLYENNKKLAVLEERNRLGRELHDSVIQSLYSLTLLAGGWKRFTPEEKSTSSDEFVSEFSEIVQQSLKEMRLLVYNLRPPVLEQEGLLGALHVRLDAVEKRAGIETRLLADDIGFLDIPTQEGIYGIAQEALNNTLKHANANHVIIQLFNNDDAFLMTINDDGQGIQPDVLQYHKGLGLISMRERAEKMKGSLVVTSKPGEGTTVTLEIPLRQDDMS